MKTEQELRLIALEWAVSLKKEKAETLEIASEYLQFLKPVESYRMNVTIVEKQGFKFYVEANGTEQAIDILTKKYPNHEIFADCKDGGICGFKFTGLAPFVDKANVTPYE